MFGDDWQASLNPAQYAAVTCGDGPVLVIAGAQARVVADYTVPVPDKSAPDKPAEHAARPPGDLSGGQAQPNTAGAVPPPAPVAAASLTIDTESAVTIIASAIAR